MEVTTSANRCCPSATSAGDRRRRPVRINTADHAPFSTVATAFSAMPWPGTAIACGRLPGFPGVLEDRQRGDDDQHALDHGGEEFRLVVAIGMIGVGRNGGEPQRHQRDDAGRDVDVLSSASE